MMSSSINKLGTKLLTSWGILLHMFKVICDVTHSLTLLPWFMSNLSVVRERVQLGALI